MTAAIHSIAEGQGFEAELKRVLTVQRAAFAADPNPSLDVRRDRLARLEKLVHRDEAVFAKAIAQDFGTRSEIVTSVGEAMPVVSSARYARKHLARWMKPRRVAVEMTFKPARARIVAQPLGVVGIIGAWNYPLQLTLSPLVGALAAGDRAMLKPSELTPLFAEALKRSVGDFFTEDEVAVVTGGPDVAAAFSSLPFDHLIFTGSTAVGRIVAQAAAKNLTPVTLELGGKSPAIVDASADLKVSADRLVWGKLFNTGQTCIAPDYALVPREKIPAFVDATRAAAAKQYPTIAGNPDYASIVSDRHFVRLKGLVEDARAKGAEVIELAKGDDASRIFPPVVILDPTPDMTVMQEEIFGPILPVVACETADEAIAYVNSRDRPLSLYWFGEDKAARDKVLARTISGGVSVNDTIMHIVQEALPFGGVGPSGQGHYHGEHGFRSLSKEKPIFYQSRFSTGGMIYPPYGAFTRRLLGFMKRFG